MVARRRITRKWNTVSGLFLLNEAAFEQERADKRRIDRWIPATPLTSFPWGQRRGNLEFFFYGNDVGEPRACVASVHVLIRATVAQTKLSAAWRETEALVVYV